MKSQDQFWMEKALKLAKKAYKLGEVPVGALVVKDNQIISQAFNRRESWLTPIAHAEIIALHRASQALGAWRLLDCTLYVTLEPCVMCAGALVLARVPRLVFAATDPKGGAVSSLYRVVEDQRLNHNCEIISGVMAEESSQMIKSFFKERRSQNKSEKIK